MGFVREGNRRAAEVGRKIQLKEWVEEHGFAYLITDDTLGEWHVRGDSSTYENAQRYDSMDAERVEMDPEDIEVDPEVGA